MNPKEAAGKLTAEALKATIRVETVNSQNIALIKGHLQNGGTALLYSNHFAKLDPIAYAKVIIESGIPLQNITVLASRKHFDPQRGALNKMQSYLGEGWQSAYGLDIVQVVQTYDRKNYPDWEEFNRKALRKVLEAARTPSHVIYIAPEGTRSRNNELLRAENGLGLIFRMGRNMIAVPIAGEHHRILPLVDKVRITVGEPFRLDEIATPTPRNPEEITDLMMIRLARLLPPKNRGAYANLVS